MHLTVVDKVETGLSAVLFVRFLPSWVSGYGKVTVIVLTPPSLGIARSLQLCAEGARDGFGTRNCYSFDRTRSPDEGLTLHGAPCRRPTGQISAGH
jgi:hypothetical protein